MHTYGGVEVDIIALIFVMEANDEIQASVTVHDETAWDTQRQLTGWAAGVSIGSPFARSSIPGLGRSTD